MAQNTSGNAHVTITVNGQEAINFYNKLKKEEKDLAQLAKAGDKEAEKRMHNVQGMLTDVEKELAKVDDVLRGKTFANLNTLEMMAKRVKAQMRYVDTAEDLKKLQIQYKGLTDRIRELTNDTSRAGNAFGRLFQRAAEYTSFYMILNRGRAVISNAIQGNLKLSDSISDIQKVSGLSEEGVKSLVSQIEKLDSRNAPDVLNNMAYAAGKLGIKGSENLLGFTKAADKLNVALKEYLGDGADGVVQLMKFANVMGTTNKFGVEEALLKTGSALNYMTQSTAAAADYMIEFAGRFGPIARQAKMTEGDVIGLASALDALTVNNEEAATSLQKFVLKLLSSPVHVAKALGIDANTAKNMVETGKSIELIEMALGKLGERAEKYGVSGITSVIGDIGAKGQAQRLVKTLATLSNNTQMLHDYVVMANGAFEKGTSIIDEYNIKNQNAAAIMERMRNSWEKMLVNSENVGVVKELAQSLYDMSQELQQSTAWVTGMKVAFEGLVIVLRAIVWMLPTIISYITALGLSKIVVGIMSAVKAIGMLVTSLRAGAAAWGSFNAVMRTNAIGLVISAITLLVSLVWRWVELAEESARKTKEFNNKIKGLTTSTEDYNKELYKEQRTMDDLFAKTKAANKNVDEKKRLIAEINTKYGKYLDNLLTEKSSIDEIKKAQEQANRALRQNIALKVKQGKLEELSETFATKGGTALESFRSGVEKTGLSSDDIYKAQNQIQELIRQNYGKKGYGGPNQATVSILKELAKGDNRWNYVINNRKDVGSIYDFVKASKARGRDYSGNDAFSTAQREAAYKKEKEMVAANQQAYQGIYDYVSSVIEMTNAERKVNELYAPMIGDLEERLAKQNEKEDEPITVIEDFKKDEEAQRKAEREELEEAKKNIQAVKSQLTAFYEWRESEINGMRERGEITEAVKTMLVDANKSMHAQSEMNAWQYLLSKEGAKEVWQERLQLMKEEILNSNPQMQALWEYLGQVNMEALGDTLKRLGSQEVGGMEKTIAQDAAIIQKAAAKHAQAIQKELEKYDYEKIVRSQFSAALTQMGLFRTTWDNGVRDSFKSATEAADAAMRGLVAVGDEAFKFDMNTSEGVEQFRTALSEVQGLALDTGKMTEDELKLMYLQVIELSSQMDEANKKSYQHLKRQQEIRFKGDGSRQKEQTTDKQLEKTGKMKNAGIGQSLAEQIGLGSIAEDPELQRIQNRIYWRQKEYEDAKLRFEQKKALQDAELAAMRERGATEAEIETMRLQQQRDRAGEEALMQERETSYTNEMNNLTAKIAEEMKERAQAITKLITPVTDFTQAAGRKIGDMIFDMESEEASWEELWKNMALAVGESVIQMGAQYAQNLIMQQSMAKASEATAIEEAEVGTMAGIAEGSAKTIGKLGWWGIPLVAVISALLMGLLQSALSTKKSVDSKSSSSSSTKSSIRLVKGMLTYDEGNVQTFRQAKEGGAYTVLGNDGRVYSAHKQSELPTGIVRRPTATLVNGQPSLVAERGPELIVGRKTLRAMTQFRPDLVNEVVKFDYNRRHGFRLYDEGNLDDIANMTGNGMRPDSSAEDMKALAAAMQESRETNEQTLAVLTALTAELHRGIGVRKWGTGGLVEEVIDGLYTTKRKNTSPMLRRLLG